LKEIKEGDLVELTKEVGGYYHSMMESHGAAEDSIGVVTRIINSEMVPALVEVTWSSGNIRKYYADDLIALNVKKN
tara:strand:+ start:14070 stop:14297 length:228 start_codon:yes stop_codon:yes gene_type:complete